ncbi:hypothetical protein ACFL4N_02850 [Thermodesulfobacteriota bacterium]
MEKEVGFPYHFFALPENFQKVIIGCPFVLVEEKGLWCGVTVRGVREIKEEGVMMTQFTLHIGCDNPDIAITDAMDPAHGGRFPERKTFGFRIVF